MILTNLKLTNFNLRADFFVDLNHLFVITDPEISIILYTLLAIKNWFRLLFEDFPGYFEDFSAVKITAKSSESTGNFSVGKRFHLEHIESYPKVRILNYKRSDHILECEFKFKFSFSQFFWIKNFRSEKTDLFFFYRKNFFRLSR